ncbi:MAG: ABC transporter substrate-binding protein/permease [Acidobacteriota bacterium]|nr:ABC transporter substrate-binding protein/permease [Acidobacteriota bacterium]
MRPHAVLLALLLVLVTGAACPPASGGVPAAARPPLLWGGDAEGGAPFVEADPRNPSVVRGMDVEVAGILARGLGREPRFVQVAFTSIDASVERGDFTVGLSGVEDTPARRAAHALTVPYYEFREVLTVRTRDRDRFRNLRELKGRRVGTLAGTIAYELLVREAGAGGFEVVSYDDDVHPYSDLAAGRLDGVVLDHIIAQRALRHVERLVIQREPLVRGRYVGVLARSNRGLRDRFDAILKAAMRDGTLEGILRRWNVWDEEQPRLFASVLGAASPVPAALPPTRPAETPAPSPAPSSTLARTVAYLPGLFRASLVTLLLSCLAMALAAGAGIVLASGRIYGGPIVRLLFGAYVEVVRGTPVLLQLFVLYYGLSAVVRLPAFVAALLGLGLNYAAYESEIYRGALLAVSRAQLEAARTLGLSEWLILRLVRGPQAFRLALAPMTNDFVALLKDSSLVSVITVVELTKATAIFATNIGSWLLPGVLCAAIYLAMSLPLSRLARSLERRWSATP